MPEKKFPQTEVVLPNGERFKTDMPVWFSSKRTIVQQYFPPGLHGVNVVPDLSQCERDRSQSFNLKDAINKAKKALKVEKGVKS
jgi:hypothetical protein